MSNHELFPNGTSFRMWMERNCDQCTKCYEESKDPGDGTNPNCEIESEVSMSYLSDGCLRPEARERIGNRLKWDGETYLEHNCPEFKQAP